jgi:hypothetical protein
VRIDAAIEEVIETVGMMRSLTPSEMAIMRRITLASRGTIEDAMGNFLFCMWRATGKLSIARYMTTRSIISSSGR